MSSLFLAAAPLVAGASMVALKAIGEIHRFQNQDNFQLPTLMESSYSNNVLARQGTGLPSNPGEAKRLARQRAGGIKGNQSSEPGFLSKVPTRAKPGDIRENYVSSNSGTMTSSKGNIDDILNKVPDNGSYGFGQYKNSARLSPNFKGQGYRSL